MECHVNLMNLKRRRKQIQINLKRRVMRMEMMKIINLHLLVCRRMKMRKMPIK